MIQPLNEIVGLPPATAPAELAGAADRYCQTLFDRASCGDADARRQLVELHVAYLTWAYASRQARQFAQFGYCSGGDVN